MCCDSAERGRSITVDNSSYRVNCIQITFVVHILTSENAKRKVITILLIIYRSRFSNITMDTDKVLQLIIFDTAI